MGQEGGKFNSKSWKEDGLAMRMSALEGLMVMHACSNIPQLCLCLQERRLSSGEGATGGSGSCGTKSSLFPSGEAWGR